MVDVFVFHIGGILFAWQRNMVISWHPLSDGFSPHPCQQLQPCKIKSEKVHTSEQDIYIIVCVKRNPSVEGIQWRIPHKKVKIMGLIRIMVRLISAAPNCVAQGIWLRIRRLRVRVHLWLRILYPAQTMCFYSNCIDEDCCKNALVDRLAQMARMWC